MAIELETRNGRAVLKQLVVSGKFFHIGGGFPETSDCLVIKHMNGKPALNTPFTI